MIIKFRKHEPYKPMSLVEFGELMLANGFEVAYENLFDSPISGKTESEFILFDKKSGLIIYADSEGGKVCSAKLYGQIEKFDYTYQENDEEKYPLIKSLVEVYDGLKDYYKATHDKKSFIEENIMNMMFPECNLDLRKTWDKDCYSFSCDLFVNPLEIVDNIKNNPDFVKPKAQWQNFNLRLWFSNSAETKEGADYTNLKLSQCPKKMIQIIGHNAENN